MSKELVDRDILDDTYVHDVGEGKVVVENVFRDVTPILEQNKIDRGNQNKLAQGRHVARVDQVTVDNWKAAWERGPNQTMTFMQYCALQLNDRNNSQFLTHEGTI